MHLKRQWKSVVIYFKVDILEMRRRSNPSAAFMLSHRISKDDPVPRFAIMDQSDVPVFPSERNTIAASRLNDSVRMLNFLVEKQESISTEPFVAVPS